MVFRLKFSSAIGSSTYLKNMNRTGERPVVPVTVILSAKSTAARWSIHISFCSLEQAVSLDSVSAIDL